MKRWEPVAVMKGKTVDIMIYTLGAISIALALATGVGALLSFF